MSQEIEMNWEGRQHTAEGGKKKKGTRGAIEIMKKLKEDGSEVLREKGMRRYQAQ